MRHLRPVFLVLLLVTVLPAVVLANPDFLVRSLGFDVTVGESITVDAELLDVFLFPGESEVQDVLIENAADVDTPVGIDIKVTPENQGVRAVVEEDRVLVPAEGFYELSVFIEAALDTVPGEFRVQIKIRRLAE